MHETQPFVTDVRSVCLSVCLSCGSTRLRCAKTVEQIKMLCGVNTSADVVLHGGSDPPQTGRGNLLLNFGTFVVSAERLKLET